MNTNTISYQVGSTKEFSELEIGDIFITTLKNSPLNFVDIYVKTSPREAILITNRNSFPFTFPPRTQTVLLLFDASLCSQHFNEL